MLLHYTADDALGSTGFELHYNCEEVPPEPAPEPDIILEVGVQGQLVDGTVADASGTWFQFQAVAGETYQLETQTGSLINTVMDLVDTDHQTTLAHNDDDIRYLALP